MKYQVVALLLIAGGCRAAPEPPPAARAVEKRQLGSWNGKGSTTLGFVSESGSFRINWMTRNPEGTLSSFQLTLRSGISGRPLKVITDHRGAGSGSVEFGDDPRMYEFLVDSTGVDWSVSVEETFAPRE